MFSTSPVHGGAAPPEHSCASPPVAAHNHSQKSAGKSSTPPVIRESHGCATTLPHRCRTDVHAPSCAFWPGSTAGKLQQGKGRGGSELAGWGGSELAVSPYDATRTAPRRREALQPRETIAPSPSARRVFLSSDFILVNVFAPKYLGVGAV